MGRRDEATSFSHCIDWEMKQPRFVLIELTYRLYKSCLKITSVIILMQFVFCSMAKYLTRLPK